MEDIIIFGSPINYRKGTSALFVQVDKEQIVIFTEKVIEEFKTHILNFKPSINSV